MARWKTWYDRHCVAMMRLQRAWDVLDLRSSIRVWPGRLLRFNFYQTGFVSTKQAHGSAAGSHTVPLRVAAISTSSQCFPSGHAQDGVMATRQAQQALVPGRLVLVSDPVTGMSALSVVLGEPQGYTAPFRTASATGDIISLCGAIMRFVVTATAAGVACRWCQLIGLVSSRHRRRGRQIRFKHAHGMGHDHAGGSTHTTGRQYFVLSLHRPSPQDPPEAHAAMSSENGASHRRGADAVATLAT